MAARSKLDLCCDSGEETGSSCAVESLISVDERGQMVLPKEARDKAGIKAGDKLALVSWTKEGEVCCFTLIRVDVLTDMVKDHLGPLLKDIL
jgi:antitoxin PrlF